MSAGGSASEPNITSAASATVVPGRLATARRKQVTLPTGQPEKMAITAWSGSTGPPPRAGTAPMSTNDRWAPRLVAWAWIVHDSGVGTPGMASETLPVTHMVVGEQVSVSGSEDAGIRFTASRAGRR